VSEIWFLHPQAGTKSERVTERTRSNALGLREEAGGNRRDRSLDTWRDGVRAEARSRSSKVCYRSLAIRRNFRRRRLSFCRMALVEFPSDPISRSREPPSSLKSMSKFNSESVMSCLVTQR
jgi:hypothetical protein